MVGAPAGGFEAQFQEIIFYVGPVLQLVYWLAMIVAAIWAVTLFKKWVEFQIGDSGADASDESTKSADGSIKVEEFVE